MNNLKKIILLFVLFISTFELTKPMIKKNKEKVDRYTLLKYCKKNTSNKLSLKHIKKLVNQGSDVNAKTKNNDTPIFYCCNNQNPDFKVIKYLIKKGANINIESISYSQTPFQNILKKLKNFMKKLNFESETFPITKEKNYKLESSKIIKQSLSILKIVYLFKKKDACFYGKNSQGKIPLHIIKSLEKYNVVRYFELLEENSIVNHNYIEFLKKLAQLHIFNINQKDSNDKTPLYYVLLNYYNLCKELNSTYQNKSRKIPKQKLLKQAKFNISLIKKLIKHGANYYHYYLNSIGDGLVNFQDIKNIEEYIKHLKSLQRDFRKIYQNNYYADATIINERYNSTIFNARLGNKNLANKALKILKNKPPRTITIFIKWIYGYDLRGDDIRLLSPVFQKLNIKNPQYGRNGLLEMLKRLYNDNKHYPKDFTIKTKNNKKIKVHKIILMARSKLFAKIPFEKKDICDCSNLPKKTIKDLIYFFYFDKTPKESIKINFNNLTKITKHYQLDEKNFLKIKFEKNNTKLIKYLNKAEKSEKKIKSSEIKKLLINGASINFKTDKGKSLISILCAQKKTNLQLIKLIVENGANVNTKTLKYKMTPLHFICSKKGTDSKIIKFLIKNGANYKALNCNNHNPITLIANNKTKNEILNFINSLESSQNDFKKLFKNGYFTDSNINDIKYHSLILNARLGSKELGTKAILYLKKINDGEHSKRFLKWIYGYDLEKEELEQLSSTFKKLNIKNPKCGKAGLRKMLKSLYNNNKEFPKDYLITSKKWKVKVHKLILIARSRLFRNMFSSLSKEENKKNSIKDYTKKSEIEMKNVIYFFYFNKFPSKFRKIEHDKLNDIVDFYQLNQNIFTDNQPKNKISKKFEKYSKLFLIKPSQITYREKILEAIDRGADINTRIDNFNNMFLHKVLQSFNTTIKEENKVKYWKMANILSKNNANLYLKNENNKCALDFITDKNINYLKQYITDENIKNKMIEHFKENSLIDYLLSEKNPQLTYINKLVQDHGAEINTINKNGWTPLFTACYILEEEQLGSNLDLIKYFIKKSSIKTIVNQTKNNKITALYTLLNKYSLCRLKKLYKDTIKEVISLLIKKLSKKLSKLEELDIYFIEYYNGNTIFNMMKKSGLDDLIPSHIKKENSKSNYTNLELDFSNLKIELDNINF